MKAEREAAEPIKFGKLGALANENAGVLKQDAGTPLVNAYHNATITDATLTRKP